MAGLLRVGPVGQVALDVLDHLDDLDVGAAVTGPLQGGQGGGHGGVSVRTRGGHHPGGEGGVVAAPVLHVEDEGDVQGLGLQLGVGHVVAEHPQDILRGGQAGVRPVDVHAVVVLIVVVGVVGVHRQHGKLRDQPDTLPDGVAQAAVDLVVVVGQGEHAPGHGVHDVPGGGLHDHVPGEVGGQGPAVGQDGGELRQLLRGGHLAEDQQVGDFLKAELLGPQAADEVLDVVPPVPQLPLAGHALAPHVLEGDDFGDVGQAREDPHAIGVPQAPVDPVLLEQGFGDGVVLDAQGLLGGGVGLHITLGHGHLPLSRLPAA